MGEKKLNVFLMGEKKLNVFFIPFYASGHMLPIADLAVLFARRPNVIATICLTPANAALLERTLDPSMKVLTYPFPSEASGLPAGIENVSFMETPDQEYKISAAVWWCKPALEKLLHEHRPDAIVSDFMFFWTTEVAQEMGIPRLVWHVSGAFTNLAMNSLNENQGIIAAFKDDEIVDVIKDVPGKKDLRMPACQLPEFVREKDGIVNGFWKNLMAAQMESYGAIFNTVYGMEPEYCERYRETLCKRAWFMGPHALARGRAGKEKEKEHECMRWLDTKKEGSVVYVCFGSWCHMEDEQLKEIAVGLERSGNSFLWVVRKGWTPDEEWAERVRGRGMVIKGWVPQVAVLDHRALGAFLTHCGWNSVLEASTAGVSMLTWPLVSDQFINERLMEDVVGAGKRVFNGYRSTFYEEKVVVPCAAIAASVSEFMAEERKEGKRRLKAEECKEMAKAAVAEGGSSWNDLSSLIDELKQLSM